MELGKIAFRTPKGYIEMEFVETKLFSRKLGLYLGEEDYRKLQNSLLADPGAGAVIKGSGGIRKLRWYLQGRGKRGGVRIIYCVLGDFFLMLTLYAKNELEDLTPLEIKALKRMVEDLSDARKKKDPSIR